MNALVGQACVSDRPLADVDSDLLVLPIADSSRTVPTLEFQKSVRPVMQRTASHPTTMQV